MRSPSEVAGRPTALALLGLALALSGCGTWSNEDLRFYEALPTRPELRVEVPASADAAAARVVGRLDATAPAICGPLGVATTWQWAKPTSDRINASVDWILGLVDVVRGYPPTTRLADGRIWGPFDDDKHPGVEIRIVILRSYPASAGGLPEHAYSFEARAKAVGGPFTPLLSGAFVGPSARQGLGSVRLDFDAIRAQGLADPTTDPPTGLMSVQYDRAVEPRSVQLSLAQSPGFGLVQFDYSFLGWLDGRGRFAYAFAQGGDRVTFAAAFDGAGAGRGEATFTSALGATGSFRQCWDPAACLIWVDDPAGYSCGGGTCSGGAETACPVVPPAP
jgi:hypothetical protein